MPNCSGCKGDRCSCVIQGGENVEVTGAGTYNNPYVITAEGSSGGGSSRLVGEIIGYGSGVAPAGWLVCNGQAVSRASYPALFAAIGVTHGPGDGSTTFTLPDLAGRMPLGADAQFPLGTTGGAVTMTLTTSHLPNHAHNISHNHNASVGLGGYHNHETSMGDAAAANQHVHDTATVGIGGGGDPFIHLATQRLPDATGHSHSLALTATGSHDHAITIVTHSGNSSAVGGGAAFSIMPPYATITYLIKT